MVSKFHRISGQICPKILRLILGLLVKIASGEGARTCSNTLKSQGTGLRAGIGRRRWLELPGAQDQKKTHNGLSHRLRSLWAQPIASYPSNPMSNTSPWFFWAVLSAVFAALTAIFAFTFLGERPSLREWSGMAMVAGGVLVLAFK